MGDYYNQGYNQGYNRGYNPEYNPGYNSGYSNYQNEPTYSGSNLMSRNLTNQFYKLSTQTNLLIFGYVLLMGVNHMILGDIIYNKENTYDEKKKNWFFSTVFFCTIINCFVLLWLKEKKRPVLQAPRSSKLAPLVFGLFQMIILAFTLTLFFSVKQTIDNKKKIMTAITFVALNFSVILSTWGFASSVCSIDRIDGRRAISTSQ